MGVLDGLNRRTRLKKEIVKKKKMNGWMDGTYIMIPIKKKRQEKIRKRILAMVRSFLID
jgi:hypothetical protein